MSLKPPASFEQHQDIMERLRQAFTLLFLASILRQAPASIALGNKVLHIPEKIIGGVIDIVQSHKNKPSQQSTFQQSVQTQTTFSQQPNPQGTAGNAQQWTGPAYQGPGFGGQAQIQAQGQTDFGNQGAGNFQAIPAPVYPVNNGPGLTGPSGTYPVNPGPYPVQQGFSQSQNQGQFQNFQNQHQNQNQQGNFQGQSQNQGHNQNGLYQSGQYGTGNFQVTGQYAPSNGNYQNIGQTGGGNYQNGQSSGNYHGSVGQASGGNYQNTGQASASGNYQNQNGNYQNTQTGQYPSSGQFNQNQHGQFGQAGQGGSGSGYYQGTSQSGQSSNGSQTGSFGSQSGGFHNGPQTSSPTFVCQAWTKLPGSQVLSDEPPKPDKVENKVEEKAPDAS